MDLTPEIEKEIRDLTPHEMRSTANQMRDIADEIVLRAAKKEIKKTDAAKLPRITKRNRLKWN